MENTYIYVCSPYGGREENYERAVIYGQYVLNHGHIPMIPHTMLHNIVDDRNPEHRAAALAMGRKLLKLCSEVWVFGTAETASDGMRSEIAAAGEWGIPIKYIDGKKAFEIDVSAADISRCLRHYEQTFCSLNRAIAEDIIHYIKQGISAELVNLCVDIAAKRNAGWPYAAAIIKRCLAQGIKTAEHFKRNNGQKQSAPAAAYDLGLFEQMLDEDS